MVRLRLQSGRDDAVVHFVRAFLLSNPPRKDITEILAAVNRGDEKAIESLLPVVYGELQKIARGLMGSRGRHQTLQPTALVHEAYIRLFGGGGQEWRNRRHFYSVAATAMRNLLVDEARRKASRKRGGDLMRVTLGEADGAAGPTSTWLLALDEALGRLEVTDPKMAKVVQLRYFAGLTVDETARTLEISPRSVKRLWSSARAWLTMQTG